MYAKALSTLAALALVAACAPDDDGLVTDSAAGYAATPATGNAGDANVVATLTALNAAEIRASEFVADSGENAQVKELAGMIESDHRAMNESLHSVAQQLNIVSTAGSGMTEGAVESGRDIFGELEGKRGAELDRAYVEAMVETHEDALGKLDNAAQATSTPQLSQAITEARARIQAHLDQARKLQQSLSSTQ